MTPIDIEYGADPTDHVERACLASQACHPVCDAPGPRHQDVLAMPNPEPFLASRQKEIQAHVDNRSWISHANPPPGSLVIGSLWVDIWKLDSEGNWIAKSRVVARGDRQKPNVHFDPDALYVPSVRRTSLRIICCLAAQFGLHLHHVDFVTAYLNGDLDIDIYWTMGWTPSTRRSKQ